MKKLASRVLLVMAAALAGWAVWHLFSVYIIPARDVRLVIEGPPPYLGTLTPGVHHLRFRISNFSGQDKKLIGMTSGSRPNVSFAPRVTEPIEIPAGVVFDYLVELKVSGEVEFDFPLVIFFEDNGLRRYEVNYRGAIERVAEADAKD